MNSLQSHNLDVALQLAAQGVFVFPCVGRGDRRKMPCPGVAWRSSSTTDPRKIKAWWQCWPDAVPAIDVGRSGMLAVDCDTKQSDGKAWLVALLGEELLATVPGGETPSGGRHYLFKNPKKLGNGRGSLPPKTVADIDIRGNGGYIIAPGARFTDGTGNYVACGSLANANVPDMPAMLDGVLTGVTAEPAPPTPRPASPPASPASPPAPRPQAAQAAAGGGIYVPGRPISDSQREAYGRNAIAGAAAELAAAQIGERNEIANAKAFHLGRLAGAGYLTQGEAYSALEAAGLSLGLSPKDKLFGPKGTLWRGIEAGVAQPLDPLAGREEPGVVIDIGTRSTWVEPEPEEPPPPVPPSIMDLVPEDWLQPKGLLGEMADWIMATSRRPNRPMAVAAATAVLSTLCGRHLYAPTGTALNLYIVLLSSTGGGKDRPLAAVHALLKAASFPALAQTGKAFSVSAMEQLLLDHPCCCAIIDEVGPNLLNKIFHRNARTHESSIRSFILELWGRSQGREPFATTRRAKTPGVPGAIPTTVSIASPNLDILSASTLEAFYETLTGGRIMDGFMNRFLLAHGGARGATQNVPLAALVVPQKIAEELNRVVPLLTGLGNVAAACGVFDINAPLEQIERRVPWAKDGDGTGVGANGGASVGASATEAAAMAFEEELLTIGDANEKEAPLLNRVFETAIRLATIHAVSVARIRTLAEVGAADWAWGKAWALTSARNMIRDAGRYMADSEAQAVARAIKRALVGKGRTSRSALVRALDHKYKARDLDDVLGSLVTAGEVKEDVVPTKGRNARWYTWM
jgi:Bifunctional DNA primase/polymerase, N-terminal